MKTILLLVLTVVVNSSASRADEPSNNAASRSAVCGNVSQCHFLNNSDITDAACANAARLSGYSSYCLEVSRGCYACDPY